MRPLSRRSSLMLLFPARYRHVAGQAHLGVSLPEPGGVEPRTVRIELVGAQRRVTLQAITLGVTGHAALKALPGRLAVPGEEELLPVVIATAQGPSGRHQTGGLVTVGAERGGVVAFAAGVLPPVRRGRVPGQKSRGMEAGRAGPRVGPVAAQAVRPHVAHGAVLWGGRGRRPVPVSGSALVGRPPAPPPLPP